MEKLWVLESVARELNREGLLWLAGGSFSLSARGIVDSFRDLDLMVALESAGRADEILRAIGEAVPSSSGGIFETAFFREYKVGGVEVDLMANLAIRNFGFLYRYPFGPESVSGFKQVGQERVPLAALEDWLVSYRMMGREQRADAIHAYLLQHGVSRPELLRRAICQALPERVIREIQALLQAG